MCCGLIVQKKGILITKKPIKHESAYRYLQVVLCDLVNIVVVAF
jgi:hypothetical protein